MKRSELPPSRNYFLVIFGQFMMLLFISFWLMANFFVIYSLQDWLTMFLQWNIRYFHLHCRDGGVKYLRGIT